MRWRVWVLAHTQDQLMARWTKEKVFEPYGTFQKSQVVIGIETCKIKVQDMPMEGDFMGDQDMPQPPQDNNQVKIFPFWIQKIKTNLG